MSKPGSRVMHFLGFGKKPTADDTAAESSTEETKAKDQDDDEEEEDEDDEDERPEASEEEKAATSARNRLRAAGERRGRRLERERIGTIVNGIAPAQAQFALHLGLNTDMTVEQAQATLAAAPKGGGKGDVFAAAMAAVTSQVRQPGFGAGAPGKSPSLSERMAATLDKQKKK